MEAKYTLTVVDVTGIQHYIFGSNRLAENVGASQLVHQATTAWLRDALPVGRHNLQEGRNALTIDRQRFLEEDATLDAEVVLCGGGNVLILFRTGDLARATITKLSQRILCAAPGIEIAVAHQEFNWNEESIGGEKEGVHYRLYQTLNQAKQQRRPSAPLLSLGVTLECAATGLPAVGFTERQGQDDTPRAVSAEVLAKHDYRDAARARFEQIFGELITGYNIPPDFDDLGGSRDEMRYIAVVHADGNGMGKRFQKEIEKRSGAKKNRDCLNALRDLSIAVDQAGMQALKATVQRMIARFDLDQSEEMRAFVKGLEDPTNNGERNLPFRPIVYGGDDVTFVCDGRIGLSLARIYLEEWERVTQAQTKLGQAYACAGVAIVKTRYPFVRAYELAEALCKGAKQQLRKAECGDASALDWHFAMSGIGGTIQQIREREYHDNEGKRPLYLRPVGLRAGVLGPTWYGWDAFDRTIRSFQNNSLARESLGLDGGGAGASTLRQAQGSATAPLAELVEAKRRGPELFRANNNSLWRERRNKVKQLREVLREGANAVERFRIAFNIPLLPELDQTKPDLQEKGWYGNHCGYFDAIEALDFYLPLTEEG
ncbi:Cas10/Cmr2 second palm domain-containing protein [Candidatus Viridilinea mediisalina]|uniref:Cas10/Cmr2 second palm domain-containing protein n=1 Tax=Candidatus Viridilinea mediisalina TaxID=2024553 RepID=A0A2A6RGA6_9CHLR|nr:hypothetical protein [Candidatus Viridilinea mediisalina]PDW01973.1 hypothetical protein CJ255_16315 [Candidatus Viridilinea mediisalina]